MKDVRCNWESWLQEDGERRFCGLMLEWLGRGRGKVGGFIWLANVVSSRKIRTAIDLPPIPQRTHNNPHPFPAY